MNQPQITNRCIQLILVLFMIMKVPVAQSQRIFTSAGVLVSTFDDGISEAYNGAIIRSSVGFGFETKQWHRLSLTAVFSHFTSGGKTYDQNYEYDNFKNYYHLYFNTYSVGAIGNFYMINRKTQFYIGLGPRLDYVRSQQPMYDNPGGTDNYFSRVVLGASGSIGVNFQLDNFNLGIKSTYYYRPSLYENQYYNMHGAGTRVARDYPFDLQLVFAYTLGKRKSGE